MAFKDSFHEIVPGYRINGDSVVFVIKGVKTGGIGSGAKTIEIGNIGVASRNFIETDDLANWPAYESYIPVEDIDKLYEQLELSGLSTVVDGVLVNPANISLLEYNDNKMVADAAGDGGKFTFMRADVSGFERKGNTWKVPDGEFDAFKELALARLTTILGVAGQAANAYIHFDGSNDYVEFTGTSTGLLDWDADWTVGVSLVEFEVKADGKVHHVVQLRQQRNHASPGWQQPRALRHRQRRRNEDWRQYLARPEPRRQAAVHLRRHCYEAAEVLHRQHRWQLCPSRQLLGKYRQHWRQHRGH